MWLHAYQVNVGESGRSGMVLCMDLCIMTFSSRVGMR